MSSNRLPIPKTVLLHCVGRRTASLGLHHVYPNSEANAAREVSGSETGSGVMPIVRELFWKDHEKHLTRIGAMRDWSFLKEDRLPSVLIAPEDFGFFRLLPSKRKDADLYWNKEHFFYELTKLEYAVLKLFTNEHRSYKWQVRSNRRDPPFTMREQILFSMVSRGLLDFNWRGVSHWFEIHGSLSTNKLVRVDIDISNEEDLYVFLVRNGWKPPAKLLIRYAKRTEICATKCRNCSKDIIINTNREWNSTPLFCSIKCYHQHHKGKRYNCIVCGRRRAMVMDFLADDPYQEIETYKNRDQFATRYFDIAIYPPFIVCDPYRTKEDCLKELTAAIKNKKVKIQRAIIKGAKKAGIIDKVPKSKIIIEEVSKIIMEHLDGTHRS